MIGKIFLDITLAALLFSSILYFLSTRSEKWIKYARWLFYISVAGIVLASFYLLANILTHNFEITYVWEHSSKHLEDYLLISSFYAGQQGSFLLWLLFFAVVGLLFRVSSRKVGYESLNMAFFTLTMFFIALMLVMKNPFDYIWETYAADGIEIGYKPMDGRGLNPVLENYWMAIHPPILFIGYALLAVPFVYALSGIIRKEFDKWLEPAMPWTLAGAGVLGLGIMLGGFWAYETLGWGGFWGWDPVENSSLIPWIIVLTFIHTAAIQKSTQALKKTNILLAILSFILVLYATFLTRSGVLGDASVHSFTDPGKAIYILLIGVIILNGLIALYSFLIRAKDIKSKNLNTNLTSREMMLAIASIVLLAVTLIIFFGTNWSLITDVLATSQSKVDISFFNTWTLPFALVIFLTNGISLYLNWKKTSMKSVLKGSLVSIILTAAVTVIVFVNGISEISYLLLILVVFYSLFVNLEFLVKKLFKNKSALGGLISHIGFAVFMIGVIFSGALERTENIQLTKGNKIQSNEYVLELLDKFEIEKPKTDRQKFLYKVKASKDDNSFIIEPVVYWSSFNNMEQPIIEPGIKRTLLQDIYLSLKSADVKNPLRTLTIKKGQKTGFLFDSTVSIEFLSYDMGHTHMGHEHAGNDFGALVKVTKDDISVVDTLFLNVSEKSVFDNIKWKKLSLTDFDVSFIRFIPKSEDIAESQIVLAFNESNKEFIKPVEFIFCEISYKPFMNAVWLGVFLITLGFFLSIIFRKKTQE